LLLALACPYKAIIIKHEDGKEYETAVFYNAIPVKLPGRDYPLFLVVAKGFGKEPMMLITSFSGTITSKI
jgi:hypothetical protein